MPSRSAAVPKSKPETHRKELEAEQLIKWIAIAGLTALIVIGLMKGMLALAVYLIRTLPMSLVS